MNARLSPVAFRLALSLGALTVTAAISLAVSGCRSTPAAGSALTQPPPDEVWLTPGQLQDAKVRIEPIAMHTVGDEVAASGKVAFDDRRVAHVFSPVTGRIRSILAQPGARVKKGAPLATIDSPEVGNASADLGKANADLTAAEHDLRRQKELYDAHAGSARDYESAQDSQGKAKAEMERSRQKARLFGGASSEAVTQGFTLRAPIDGEVIARNLNPGAEVQGQYGGGTAVELFTIGELDQVWVFADIFEMDLARVRQGATVTLKAIAYPDEIFTGTVDWIAGALDPISRTARIRCSIPNPHRELKPEMYATVSVSVAGASVPALPRTAVLRIADQTAVFVQNGAAPDGRLKFVRRIVAVNEDQATDYLPIVRGVAPGDRIVTTGAVLLAGML
jgi:membrane fusion protein, heavy metal efflux system